MQFYQNTKYDSGDEWDCCLQGAPPLGLKLDTAAVLAQMSNTRLIQA